MPRPGEFEPEQVLGTAMREFWARGYRATSVDDLVRATGVKPGCL
jgi:TetR/AcrR family transcriptional regulator, transcriptional repressor for nem operon